MEAKKEKPNFGNEDDWEGKEEYQPGQHNDEIQLLIKKCKIDIQEELEPPPVAMRIKSGVEPITLFTKGNFSIITGAAKSRKTFLISMLMAAAVKGNFQDLFYCHGEGVNIIFDTEQSRYKAQQIAKRICKLSDTVAPSNLIAFSLRTLNPNQRLAVIDEVIKSTPNINFIAIDGIIDLDIDPILQADQAQRIILNLMQWSDVYKIHIACVLHYNKTISTLLGHLGSFSHRKADAIISVTKSKENENISLVEPVDCREKEFEPFAFTIDNYGMPYIIEDFSFSGKPKEKVEIEKDKKTTIGSFGSHLLNDEEQQEILKNSFIAKKKHTYEKMWRSLQNASLGLALKKTSKPCADNAAKKLLTHFQNMEKIIEDNSAKTTMYVLAGQSEMF